MRHRSPHGVTLLLAVVAVFALVLLVRPGDDSGVDTADTAAPESRGSTQPPREWGTRDRDRDEAASADGDILAALDALPVRGRAPTTGYSREMFGDGWLDLDGDGCDTREEILRRDLMDVVYRPDDPGCTVSTGVLDDPFSGQTITYVKGSESRPGVDIDHVVALSDAWQKGASRWDGGKRIAFANDPINLLAVDRDLNQQKSDSDAASWLPPNRAFWCDYAAAQVSVKYAYTVSVTAAERDSLGRVLSSCPPRAPTSSPMLAQFGDVPDLAETSGADRRFDSCSQAKAYGLGPYRQGTDPEYNWYTDGDSDGIVCE